MTTRKTAELIKPETIEYFRTVVVPAIRNYDGTMPQHLQAGANTILALCEAFEEQSAELASYKRQAAYISSVIDSEGKYIP